MKGRIKQFVTAVTARIFPEDRRYVERFLSSAEQRLFWNMNLPEQRHALNVAYTAAELARMRPDADSVRLIRAALLHDVGKIKGDISIPDKVITVVADTVCPRAARRFSREGRGDRINNLRHAMFVYYRHADRGADLLQRAGTDARISEWVRRHHEPPLPSDSPELELLKEADSRN